MNRAQRRQYAKELGRPVPRGSKLEQQLTRTRDVASLIRFMTVTLGYEVSPAAATVVQSEAQETYDRLRARIMANLQEMGFPQLIFPPSS